MFLINKDAEFDTMKLGKILRKFQSESDNLPRMKRYYSYYKGDQDIKLKPRKDVGKPDHRIVVNFMSGIVSNFAGYLVGNDIKYRSDNNFDSVQEVLLYNDVHSVDGELLKNALIMGKGVELLYVDEDAHIRFKPLDPRECIDIYDDTLNQNLIYGVRFYKADYINRASESYIVEVYDNECCRKYSSNAGFSSFTLIEEVPHYFGQVPMNFFYLNTEADSIFDRVIPLQDAYNELLSDEVNDFDSFCDCYMVLKGLGGVDANDLANMKQSRILSMDADADASYLTKNVSDTQIQNLLDNIKEKIHTIANSPDFTDAAFGTASGISMKFKLLGFENVAGTIEAQMRKALQRRIELICNILAMVDEEAVWRDVDIIFTRNLPVDLAENADVVNKLRGLVSDETLLGLLSFVKDPSEEIDRINKQKEANMSMYGFGAEEDEEEDDE